MTEGVTGVRSQVDVEMVSCASHVKQMNICKLLILVDIYAAFNYVY